MRRSWTLPRSALPSAPQTAEEILEEFMDISIERLSERTVEQIVDFQEQQVVKEILEGIINAPLVQTLDEKVEVVNLVAQAPVQERTVEQRSDVTSPVQCASAVGVWKSLSR